MHLEYTLPSTVKIPESLKGNFSSSSDVSAEDFKICIVGMDEFRGNIANKGCEMGPDAIREQLFQLKNFPNLKILDAGNIKMGDSYRDSLYALKQTVHELLEHNIIPIILGGDKTMLWAQEQAYHNLPTKTYTNVIQVDESFDLAQENTPDIHQNNYLNHILNQEPNLIFNFTQLGYQSYFVDALTIDIMRKMDFECYRLGELRADLKEVEPIVRDGDMLAFNVSALNSTDGIGYHNTSPNGFTAVEACQIMRYAGLSDRLSSVGFYGYNPVFDERNHTAKVIAQALWYFIQGVSDRKMDYPVTDEKQFNIYVVSSKELGYDITFMKSIKSDRWWIKIPDEYIKYKSHQMFPCSYKDYQMALQDEIPERWWKAYNKLV
jgi:arginase family enzyme